MQALTSSALGSPLEAQAAGDAADRESDDFADLRRAAVEKLHESQRHRMGVLPGMTAVFEFIHSVDLPRYDPPQVQMVPLLTVSIASNVNVIVCRSEGCQAASHCRFAQDRSVH